MNPLPGAKGRPDDEHRLFILNLLPCLFSPSCIVKVPSFPIRVGRRQIKREPWNTLIFGHQPGGSRHTRRRLQLADNNMKRTRAFSLLGTTMATKRPHNTHDVAIQPLCFNTFLIGPDGEQLLESVISPNKTCQHPCPSFQLHRRLQVPLPCLY